MSVSINSVIGHPNDNYNYNISVNGESQANFELPSNFSSPLGFGSTEQYNALSRNFGTGATISNFTSVQGAFVQCLTNRFSADTCKKEMLVFLERSRTSPLMHLQLDHEIASLNELNRYLVSSEGRMRYGMNPSCQKLFEDFGFAGSFNAAIPDHVVSSRRQQHDSAIVIGRRARITAVTRGFVTKGEPITDRLMNTVHLLGIRRRLLSTDVLKTRDVEGASMFLNDNLYYWNLYIYVSPSNATPPPHLYIDDESTGMAIRVGVILQYNGNNKQSQADVERAQRSLSGPVNALQQDKAYLSEMPLLPYVDVLINM